MAECYHCDGKIIQEKGPRPIDVGHYKIIIRDPLKCDKCGNYYLSGEQLVEGFEQMREFKGN